MHFSINWSIVICSPTVILMLSWEKPLVKPYGPRVYLLSYKFPIYFYLHLLLSNLYHKNTKKISYLIISIRSHFCKLPWRDWQPLYRVGCEVLVCLCRCVGHLRCLLLDWYHGSQKLREILTLLCCITLSSSRKTNASSRRSSHLWDQDGPLLVHQGGVVLHKEQTNARQHNRDHTGSFTQVRASVRHKTLLLLWWIDGGKVEVVRSTIGRQGLLWDNSDYLCGRASGIAF